MPVTGASSCSITRLDGASHLQEWKEALWDRFVAAAPRPRRPSAQQYESIASFDRGASRALGIDPKTVATWPSARRSRIAKANRRNRAPPFSSKGKRRWALLSGGTGSWHLITVSMACSRRSRICPRSALHRCLQRHGISRPPGGRSRQAETATLQALSHRPSPSFLEPVTNTPARSTWASPKCRGLRASSLFIAIDRTSRCAVTQLVEKANRPTAWECLGVPEAPTGGCSLPGPHYPDR